MNLLSESTMQLVPKLGECLVLEFLPYLIRYAAYERSALSQPLYRLMKRYPWESDHTPVVLDMKTKAPLPVSVMLRYEMI